MTVAPLLASRSRTPMPHWLGPFTVAATCLLAVACGMPGAPQAPSLHLPEVVNDLAASRTGDAVHLSWTMPRRTTDRVLLSGPIDVHICRKVESDACVAVADIQQPAEHAAQYDERLPDGVISGTPHLLTYFVELRNHAGHSAGPSNPAFSASGAAPSPLAGFAASMRPQGVLLHWDFAPGPGPQPAIRLHRTLEHKPGAAPAPAPKSTALDAGQPLQAEQTLEVDPVAAQTPDHALDKDAVFNQTYHYTAQRVLTISLAGHSLELRGTPSPVITVDARDIFPPRPPVGLVAVADAGEGAIDLSWTPNTEPDLAGYIVYRQGEGTSAALQRISPPTPPLLAPAYRDATAAPGHTYRYEVAAFDRDGNQSAHSTAAQETLPPPR